MLTNILEKRLQQLEEHQAHALLVNQTLTGLEKESLRVTPDARMAQTPHPAALGASLTHPSITTDYAENLIELVTPPVNTATALLNSLEHLHTYVYQHINHELLWSASMPCPIKNADEVPVAQYGHSHNGRMRTLYRVGLGHRYQKKMQTIAGIHFNYSFAEAFWQIYHDLYAPAQQSLRTTRDNGYFALVRNYLRHGWLIDYLFGASPALDQSFLAENPSARLSQYKQHTQYAPYACSLRMSDIGYHNDTQSDLNISFNDLDAYANGLISAVHTPYPAYQAIFERFGKDAQISANLLQIEAEYYASVRPKRVPIKGERQSQALLRAGVEYIEVRAIDINPYQPLGIDTQQIYFLEIFLLHCLLTDSPAFEENSRKIITQNTQRVVFEGRKPGCELFHTTENKPILLTTWAHAIFNDLEKVAAFLDASSPDSRYQHALNYFKAQLTHSDSLPSARMLDDLFTHYDSFAELALDLSKQHQDYFLQKSLSSLQQAEFSQLTQESLQRQQQLEAEQKGSFEQFVADYLA